MRLLAIGMAGMLFCSGANAQDGGKLVKETWDALYLGGVKSGLAHTTIREARRDGKPLLITTLDSSLQIKRDGAVVTMAMVQTCEETPEGKVRGAGVTQKLDKGEVAQFGTVEGDRILVKITGVPQVLPFPWRDDVIGLARQDRLWIDNKLQPGLEVRYRNYDPSIPAAVTLNARVQEREEVLILVDRGTAEKPQGEQVRKSLWRIVVQAEPVEVRGQKIPLPEQILWVDDEGTPLRSETEIPGMGKMTMLRVSKGLARLKDGTPAEMPDLLVNTLIKLGKPIAGGHDASSVVYRVTVKGDARPDTAFPKDNRQTSGAVRGDSFELTVRALREPAMLGLPAPAEEEFIKSSQLLDSDNERVKDLAQKIAGDETDPWKRARRVEKWVHDNMKPTTAIGLVKASQICVDLTGDCRQFGMLTAALCRAVGVPARTAMGLVYVNDPRKGPFLGFHLWTEVWIKGQWLGLDATLGKGSIGPGHIKVADTGWKDGEGLAPMLGLLRVLGRLQIEVISAE